MARVDVDSTYAALLRFGAALDASSEFVVVLDASGAAGVVFANAAFLREAGYERAALVGRGLDLLFDADDRDGYPSLLRAVAEQAASAFSVRARRADGSSFAFAGAAEPIVGADGEYAGHTLVGRLGAAAAPESDRFASVVSALQHADDNVFVMDQHVDDESYRVTFANESVVQRTGYTREEFERLSTRILNGPLTDQALRTKALTDLRNGLKARIELLLYRKDGSTYWSDLSATPIADERGRFTRFVMIERDVTERRRRREELDVLWTAFAHAHDSIIVYERPAGGGRPSIVYVNDATIRQSGFSREELLVGSSTGTGPQTDLATVHLLRDALLRGESMRVRLVLYRKDGSSYWGEIDGRPVRDGGGNVTHWISIERDITDAVERERALALLLDASRSLFGVLDLSALDAAFLGALGTVLGGTAAFAEPNDPLAAPALNEEDAVAVEPGRLAIALRAPGREPRVVIVSRDGSRAPNANERAVLALLMQTYAAAARNAALFDEVHQQRAAVLDLNRMKGDLITLLANDLNNPLTSIRGFAEFLAEEQADDSDGAVATTAIIRATERLVALGQQTLALARLEDNELVLAREPVDYGALLAEVVANLPPVVDFVAANDARGIADPVLVRALFENLVGDAVKRAPFGTSITVRTRAEDDAIAVDVAIDERGTERPPDEPGRVFDRFARLSNALDGEFAGTGFALHFARLVVRRHGGTISIEHRAGSGTSVVVRLPRNPASAAPRGVLLLEHDEKAASYAEHVLREAGYRVHVVHDAGAFEKALADNNTYAVVIAEEAGEVREAAESCGVRTVVLRKPYLAGELLRELESATSGSSGSQA